MKKCALAVVVALLTLAACGGGDRAAYEASETPTTAPRTAASTPETATSTAETATATPRSGPPAPCTAPLAATAADWPHPNYDATGSRATFTSTITSENVGRLKEAWRYELPSGGAFGIVATTPIVVGNTVYSATSRRTSTPSTCSPATAAGSSTTSSGCTGPAAWPSAAAASSPTSAAMPSPPTARSMASASGTPRSWRTAAP